MRYSHRNLLVVGLVCTAVKGSAVQYVIAESTTIDHGFVGINNRGDLLKRTEDPDLYILEHDGVNTPIPTSTGSPFYPQGWGLSDINDNGYAYGEAYTSNGTGARAAVWSLTGGWQVMPGFGYSEVAGIAGDGRCLVRRGDSINNLDYASWWLPGSDPVAVTSQLIGRSLGCDLAGNMLVSSNGVPQIVSPTLVRHTLTFNGNRASSGFITPGGIACGSTLNSSVNGTLLFWNNSGQIIESYYLPGADLFRCNESRVGVGWMSNYTRALYYSSATGPVQLDSLLTSQFSGWSLAYSYDINDSGQILAVGRAPGATFDSWCLLNPVPEPSTWLAMGLGTCCLLYRRRRSSRRG